jgi:hypothetical protein
MEAIEEMRRATAIETRLLLTHDQPIPGAQNEITRRALSLGCESILYIEEDIVVPRDLISHVQSPQLVQCVDYALEGGGRSTALDKAGRVLFCGLGCTLVAAQIFQTLPLPWFSTRSFTIDRDGVRQRLAPSAGETQYGGQDISFCYALQQAGIDIHRIDGIEVEHLRVRHMGQAHSNHGCHTVEAL